MVYMSWQDTEAAATVANNTAAWRAGQRDCAKPCTDWGRDVACCDGIYLPSILFRWGSCLVAEQSAPAGRARRRRWRRR